MEEGMIHGNCSLKYKSINMDPVPRGLRELASEITTVVLKGRPVNLYSYIADYLQEQLINRDSNESQSYRIVRELVYNELSYDAMLKRWGVTPGLANYAATLIQAVYRGYRVRKTMAEEQREDDPGDEEAEEVIGEPQPEHLQESSVYGAEAIQAANIIQRNFRQTMIDRLNIEKPPGEPQQRRRPRRSAPPNVHQPTEIATAPAELTPAFEVSAKEGNSSAISHHMLLEPAPIQPQIIPLSGKIEACAVVLPILDSLLWLVVDSAMKQEEVRAGASAASQQVTASKNTNPDDKTDATSPPLESLYSPPRQDGASSTLAQSSSVFEKRPALDADISAIFVGRHESISVIQPPGRAAVGVDSEEFYEAQESSSLTEDGGVHLLFNESSTLAVALQSEVDVRKSEATVTHTHARAGAEPRSSSQVLLSSTAMADTRSDNSIFDAINGDNSM